MIFVVLCLCLTACTQPQPQIEPQGQPESTPIVTTSGSKEEVPPPKPVFTLDYSYAHIGKKGSTLAMYSGQLPLEEITWQVDNPDVISVDKGVVTALKEGNATVTATYRDIVCKCGISCVFSPEKPVEKPAEKPAEKKPTGSRTPVKTPPTVDAVPASFFDDAVFVGDSVSLKLSYRAAKTKELGNAKFLVRGSYGVTNAVYDYLLMPYKGKEMKLQDAIAATGAKKVFLMMGMNDIGAYGIDKTISRYGTLLKRIREKSPEAVIYIQSMTPIYTGGEKGGLKNKNVVKYNKKLEEFALKNNCKYLDIASYMRDSTGGLAKTYCSDSYVHLTNAGADAWIRVLRAYTNY